MEPIRCTLIVFDINSKAKTNYELKLARFEPNSNSIYLEGKIYAIGGFITSKNVYVVNFKALTLHRKADMIKGKCAHTLCNARRYIYAIGDMNESKSDCQKYSVANDKWSTLPHLQEGRYYCAAFSFKNAEVYAAYGHNDSFLYVSTIEKINIANPNKWHYINVANPITPRNGMNAIQIDDTKVLIYGGKNKKGKSNGSYILSFSDRGIVCNQSACLMSSNQFIEGPTPVFDGVNVYAVSFEKTFIFSL